MTLQGIKIAESGADPINDGEITLNGGILKVKSGSSVFPISDAVALAIVLGG